MRFEYTKNVFA